MKQALRAQSIGDKLYQLERIHSKLIHLSKIKEAVDHTSERNEKLYSNVIMALRGLLNCFNDNRGSRVFSRYLNTIEETLKHIDGGNELEIFDNLCFLHGAYVKFRRKFKTIIENGCEYEFQDVCMPLYILDYKFIKLRRLKKLHTTGAL